MRIPTVAAGRRFRTTALALTITTALAGSLAACSDDDGSDPSDSSATAAQSGTVEVTHTMGTTEVPEDPGKIISFSPSFTDVFSALGRPVDVEYRTDFYGEPGPWENGDSGETLTYPMTGTPDVEKVAEADPDVIFAGYLPDQATYDRFNQIAPTIATVGSSPMSDDWREATTVAGDILGRSDDAKSLIEDAEQAFTDAKENHPALDGATGAFGQISEQGLAMVTGDADPANVFLTDLGIVIPEEIKAASLNGSRAFISEENTDLLNTDLLYMWSVGVEAKDVPTTVKGWDQLTPVKNGTAFLADTDAAMAISNPTILSAVWELEQLEDTFTALDDAAE